MRRLVPFCSLYRPLCPPLFRRNYPHNRINSHSVSVVTAAMSSGKTYRRVVVNEFGPPEVLKVEESPLPSSLANDQLPFTPGSDFAGAVEAVGPNASFKPGDRVFGAVLGASGSYTQGAAVFVAYATAYRAVFISGRARAGDKVLVHGASGGVGCAAVQMCAAMGMTVIATASSDSGRDLVQKNGATYALDHSNADAVVEEVKRLGGVDLVVEMLANINLDRDMEMLAQGGRIAVVGNRGTIEINPRKLMGVEGSIVGVQLAKSSPEQMEETISFICAGLASGTLSPVVGPSFSLEEAPKAHEAVISQKGGAHGKIVIVPQQQ